MKLMDIFFSFNLAMVTKNVSLVEASNYALTGSGQGVTKILQSLFLDGEKKILGLMHLLKVRVRSFVI